MGKPRAGLSSVMLLTVGLLSGCGLIDERSIEPPAPPPDRMDTTMGSYGQGREGRLLLVTMEADAHRSMVHHLPIRSKTNAPSALPIGYARFLDELSDRYGITRVADWPLATLGIHCLVFETDDGGDRDGIVARLSLDDRIETAQAMQLFDVQQADAPPGEPLEPAGGIEPDYDDPYLPLQHGFLSLQTGQSHRWASGSGVTVAVIDTGMDLRHPELAERVGEPRNFVDRDETRFFADVHGTAVGGVIAASANNGTGMVGVAPGATLLPLKACWQKDADGDGASCNSFTLAKALNFAIQSDVDVINLSLAGPRDALLERLTREALERDIVVVGATTSAGGEQFPASVPGIIAVSADASRQARRVNAPGRQVLSTRPDSDYQFFDGSSFSAAHIAGLAALLKELEANGTPADLLELLDETADPVTGSVNACRAVATLVGRTGTDCTTPAS